MVAAPIFVILIDEVFDAMMQPGFTVSERDLNSDRLSCKFSEAAYKCSQRARTDQNGRDYLDDHVGVPETLNTLSVIVQDSNPVPGLLRLNVLDFAFGNILGQKFIHELQ